MSNPTRAAESRTSNVRQAIGSSGLICVKCPPVFSAADFMKLRFQRRPTPMPT